MNGKPTLSFEFFPPKTERARERLWQNVGRLSTLHPSYMTVTYGAGGSTREWTIETACKIQEDTGVPVASHLTCVVTPKARIEEVASILWSRGIRHIVALRGDVPEGANSPDPDDDSYYHYSSELVEGLLKLHPFEISVAAYPEKHPDAPSLNADIEALKKKCDAGAARAITQFFFDNEAFYRFLDKVRAAGITTPIVPGILPIVNFAKAESFALKCGANVPDNVRKKFAGLEPGSEETHKISIDLTSRQLLDLIENGVSHFHFYTLNHARLTYSIVRNLKIF
jgi:methylenetetrahydrofolate reductase (NADPH)